MSKQLFDIDTFRAQPLPSEEEVMANWQGDIENPVVSVLCNTFNQKMYIEDAFRGFLIQKTDFVFEVIVHDDASTDGTSDIVRKYAKLYPKIFKSVIQTENQYSQGKKITLLSAEYARGEYIALCEGDDLWISEDKLQFQAGILDKNSTINLVVHNAYITNDKLEIKNKKFSTNHFEDQITPISSVFIVDGQFAPTASYFFRNIGLDFLNHYSDAPVADFLLEVFLGLEGVYTSSQIMSIYRLGGEGSWSVDVLKDPARQVDLYQRMMKMLNTMQKELPEEKKHLVNYKKKTVYHRLAITFISENKLKSFKFFLKSLDFSNYKVKRACSYFYFFFKYTFIKKLKIGF